MIGLPLPLIGGLLQLEYRKLLVPVVHTPLLYLLHANVYGMTQELRDTLKGRLLGLRQVNDLLALAQALSRIHSCCRWLSRLRLPHHVPVLEEVGFAFSTGLPLNHRLREVSLQKEG
jgi:hypothetical protein